MSIIAHVKINKMLISKDCACIGSGGSVARNSTTKSLCERGRLPFPVAGVIDLGDPPTQILHSTEDKLRPRELIVS